LLIEDMGEHASCVQVDAAVVLILVIVKPHLVPPWGRAGVPIPHRGGELPLKLPRWDIASALILFNWDEPSARLHRGQEINPAIAPDRGGR
jgi:hypothetical protein